MIRFLTSPRFSQRAFVVAAALAAFSLLPASPAARADLIEAGYTAIGSGSTKLLVEFAVYNSATTGGGAYGAGSNITSGNFTGGMYNGGSGPQSSFDTGASYLYLFQVVNSGTTSASGFTLPTGNAITSFGTFNSGSTPLAFNFTPSIGSPTYSNPGTPVTPNGQSVSTGTTSPTNVLTSLNLNTGASGPADSGGQGITVGNTVGGGKSTTLFGFTSSFAPTFDSGFFISGVTAFSGNVPSPAPEPSSFAMAAFASVGLLFFGVRRKKFASHRA